MFGQSEGDCFVIPFAQMECIEEGCRGGRARGLRTGEWGEGHERHKDGWGETGVQVRAIDGGGNVET